MSFAFLQPSNLPIHQPPIPQTLPKVPAEAGKTVEEAEVEKVTNAEVGKGAEVGWEAVICGLLCGFLACRALAGKIRLRFALRIGTMLCLPFFK